MQYIATVYMKSGSVEMVIDSENLSRKEADWASRNTIKFHNWRETTTFDDVKAFVGKKAQEEAFAKKNYARQQAYWNSPKCKSRIAVEQIIQAEENIAAKGFDLRDLYYGIKGCNGERIRFNRDTLGLSSAEVHAAYNNSKTARRVYTGTGANSVVTYFPKIVVEEFHRIRNAERTK